MKIETERLKIAALTPEQLELLVYNIHQLEEDLNCSYRAEKIDWFIIRKTDHVVVGMVDFKNIPDAKGEVEIGYGLGTEFEHCGYMTETVQAICGWAQSQDGVTTIIAETEPENLASEKVLQRCGFAEYAKAATVWWRLI